MDSEYWDLLGVFLVIYGPALIGALAFGLICIAAWQKPPKTVRILSGSAGAVILLADIWLFLLRPILLK